MTLLRLRELRNSSAVLVTLKIFLIDIDIDTDSDIRVRVRFGADIGCGGDVLRSWRRVETIDWIK